MSCKDVTNVTICGGGNGAHTLAGLASVKKDINVTVLDIYEDEQERWTLALEQQGFTVHLPNGTEAQAAGSVKFTVTRDVSFAIEPADVVIIVCPAFAHKVYLELIVEHLNDDTLVVGFPGQAGFEYQCLYYLRKHGKKCSVMSLETLPWACRINKYGHDVALLGFKDEVLTSIIHQESTTTNPIATLQKIIGNVPELKEASSALEILLLAKGIAHPPIMYATWKNWNGEELDTPPLFYQGVGHCAADHLEAACDEVIETAENVQQTFPQVKKFKVEKVQQWLIDHYGDQITDKSTLLTTMRTNKAFDGLVHPMKKTSSGKYVPDFTYRYMVEDVPYGIVVQRAVAEMVGVKTPVLDEIITWSQGKLGDEYIVNGKTNEKLGANARIPQAYGLYTIEDILNFCSSV